MVKDEKAAKREAAKAKARETGQKAKFGFYARKAADEVQNKRAEKEDKKK